MYVCVCVSVTYDRDSNNNNNNNAYVDDDDDGIYSTSGLRTHSMRNIAIYIMCLFVSICIFHVGTVATDDRIFAEISQIPHCIIRAKSTSNYSIYVHLATRYMLFP